MHTADMADTAADIPDSGLDLLDSYFYCNGIIPACGGKGQESG